MWFAKKPKLSFLKVWGCDSYVKNFQPDKLEPKSEKCVFIVYHDEPTNYDEAMMSPDSAKWLEAMKSEMGL